MIDAEKANYTIGRMCRLLKVDRRRYYEWRQRKAAGPSREYVNSTWPHRGGLSWPHRRGCG